MATTISPASVTGPSSTGFFSTLANLNPLKGVGTALGSGISKALGIAPTAEDFQRANPTIRVATTPTEFVNATQTNAANMLGINLKTATSGQLTQVNAKAAELLKAGSNSLTLSPVDRASGISSLLEPVPTIMPISTAPASPKGALGWLGEIVGAVAPTLIQTGLTSFQYKNDPVLRAQRKAQEDYMQLQREALSQQGEQQKQVAQLELARIQAETQIQQSAITAQIESMRLAAAKEAASVVPAAPVQPNIVVPPVTGNMGVGEINGQQVGLATLLASMMSSTQTSPFYPSVGTPVNNDLAVLQAQQASAAAATPDNTTRNLVISAVVIGGAIWFFTAKRGRRRAA